jgi:hypothetical protein
MYQKSGWGPSHRTIHTLAIRAGIKKNSGFLNQSPPENVSYCSKLRKGGREDACTRTLMNDKETCMLIPVPCSAEIVAVCMQINRIQSRGNGISLQCSGREHEQPGKHMHVTTTTLATAMGTGAGAGRVSLTLTHAQPSEKKSDRIQARFRSGGTHMACPCRLVG